VLPPSSWQEGIFPPKYFSSFSVTFLCTDVDIMIPDVTLHIVVVRVLRPLIPLSEMFSVMEVYRLSQGDAGCHHQTARTVGKASDTSHPTPLPLPMSKSNWSPASYAIIFLKSRDNC